MSESAEGGPFFVKDCSLVSLATGLKARSLAEFRDILMTVHPDSIYYHFWGERLHPHFEQPEYHNHFAAWAHGVLHDDALAEKLGVIDPSDFGDLEKLRDEVLEVVERSLEEKETIHYVRREEQFYFVQSRLIIFDTTLRLDQPHELVSIIPMLSFSSLFYHFIDARRRTPDRVDDFSSWLRDWGTEYEALIHGIRDIDPYFASLEDLKKRLVTLVTLSFMKRS